MSHPWTPGEEPPIVGRDPMICHEAWVIYECIADLAYGLMKPQGSKEWKDSIQYPIERLAKLSYQMEREAREKKAQQGASTQEQTHTPPLVPSILEGEVVR